MSEAVLCNQTPIKSDPVQENLVLEACRYSSSGCHVKDYRRDMQKHEDICVYSPIACPFCTNNEIKPVLSKDIFQHMHYQHRMYMISTDEAFVLIPVNLKNDSDQFSLFIMHNEKFLARIRLDTALRTLYCIVYCNSKIVQHLSCGITIESETLNLQKVDFPVLPATKFSGYLTKDNCAMFNLEVLRHVFTNITIRLNVTVEPPKGVVCDQRLLNSMKCCICRDLMKPPVWLCTAGHSICASCSIKFNRCPLCLSTFQTTYRNFTFEKFMVKQKPEVTKYPKCKGCKSNILNPIFITSDGFSKCVECTNASGNNSQIRNHSLEMLYNVISYPCRYKTHGCLQYVAANCSNRHELFCTFKHFYCPFNPQALCEFEGKLNKLMPHLKSAHEKDVIFNNKFTRIIDDIEMVVGDTVCFVVFDHIFTIKYRNAYSHHEWVFQLVAGTEQIQHFTFKIKCFWGNDQEFTMCNNTITTDQVGFNNIFYSIYNPLLDSCIFTFSKHITGSCKSFTFGYTIKKHIDL